VVSFHNEARYLRRCLLSLLDQTYPKDRYEIILVNDGSQDASQETISDLLDAERARVSLLVQSDRGPAAGRNLGVAHAKGAIVAFTDPDCVADKDWLVQHVESYVSNEIGGVEGRVETDWSELLYPIRVSPAGFRYVTCNMSYRLDALKEVGSFDEDFRWKEDDELAYRVIEAGWRLVSATNAVVYHPVKMLSKRALISYGLKHRYDIPFYRKHPQVAKNYFQLRRLGPLAVTPEFLFSVGSLLAILLAWLALSINTFIGFSLIALLAFLAVWQRRRMLKRKAKASLLWMAVFIVLIELGRIYGSVEFRKFLL